MVAVMSFEEHQQKLMVAFAQVLKAEERLADSKVRQQETESVFRSEQAAVGQDMSSAWARIKTLMSETGEFEVLLSGELTDFKIGPGPTRESVRIEDPAAVPDQFCKLERKPMLKEIGQHLKSLPDSERPNWARIESGEPKLSWKAVKKSTSKE